MTENRKVESLKSYFEWNNLRSFFHQENNEKINMLMGERDKFHTERNNFRDENGRLNAQLHKIQVEFQENEQRLRLENNHLKGDVDRLRGDVEAHKVQVRYLSLWAKSSLSLHCCILVVN